jgi:hypothetical protein
MQLQTKNTTDSNGKPDAAQERTAQYFAAFTMHADRTLPQKLKLCSRKHNYPLLTYTTAKETARKSSKKKARRGLASALP